jgi:hypothetical protein
MSIQEEIWQRQHELVMRGAEKQFQVVVYLGDNDWHEFINSLGMYLQHVCDDTYIGKPMMFMGATILRVARDSHRNVTTMPRVS